MIYRQRIFNIAFDMPLSIDMFEGVALDLIHNQSNPVYPTTFLNGCDELYCLNSQDRHNTSKEKEMS